MFKPCAIEMEITLGSLYSSNFSGNLATRQGTYSNGPISVEILCKQGPKTEEMTKQRKKGSVRAIKASNQTMNPDLTILPNELAYSVAERAQNWTYSAYSGEYEINDAPRNTTADRQYETRLDRAITDTQTKIESQKRVLEDVPHLFLTSSDRLAAQKVPR